MFPAVPPEIIKEVLPVKTFDQHVNALFDILDRVAQALTQAGIPYRLVGGAAVYLYVDQVDPEAARLTRDIDLAVHRDDLARIKDAVAVHGFELRHAAGVDLLEDTRDPSQKRRVHFVFAAERVQPEYVEPVPPMSEPVIGPRGVLLMPLTGLVRMKLTSFRLKDQVHIQDLDSVGLITAGIEAGLSPTLRERLRQVRASR